MASIDFEQWDKDVDTGSTNKQDLYDQMKLANCQNNGVQTLWRLSKGALVLADLAEKNKNKNKSKDFVFESLDHAKKALEVDSNSVDAHKWYCAAIGRASRFVSTKERIQYGNEFKQHSDIAISLSPNDYLLYHMYGQWAYEVAGLTWVERKLAATFLATPPESTYDDALEALLKADKLKPNWKSNGLWIAKTLIALKKYADAIKWIDNSIKLECVLEEDFVVQTELQELEAKYAKYRK